MTPFRILIYTDYDQIDDNEDLQGWGITELRKLITYKTRKFADFVVERRYRFESMPRPLRLTHDFLCQYDELWVLAFNNARMCPFELDKDEVTALFEWMNKGGGLMVAGDHAAGFCDTGNPKTFGVHGRSLGEPMKRAGQLRTWVGPPTACTDKPLPERDNYNTCEGDDPEELDLIESQSDPKPAKLLKLRKPHSLFIISETKGAKINLIERFPDHPHESQLLELTTLDNDWPPGSPLPVTAAKARDKRFPAEQRDYPLVIAWPGLGQYGRLVADSSFHHYLNVNLAGIPERDSNGFPVPNSALDQIGTFYRNLALWLLPRDKRNRMKLDVLYRLAIDPDVFEVRGSGYESLGRAAQYVTNEKWQLEGLNWLIRHAETDHSKELDNVLSELLLAENFGDKLSRDQTVMLGAVVDAFHQDFAAQEAVTPDWLKRQPDSVEMITNGLKSLRAIDSSAAEKLLSLLQKVH